VSVPSSYILVRRNGKTLVTGQCQQIPRDIGIRRLFEAEQGNKLIVSDFSQIEVRVAAELAKDKNMIEIYNKGLDVYIQTASLVLGKPYDTIKKDTEAGKSEDRSVFKVVVLASMYGMGGEKLRNQLKNALGLNLTIEQTKGYIDGLKKAFPEYFKFQRKQTEFGEKYLLALTKAGKKRKLHKDSWYGPAVNTCVQGTAAEVLLISLQKIHKELAKQTKKAKIISCVHDEIICEAPEKEAETVRKIMDKCMLEAYLLIFPDAQTTLGLAEATIGNNWAEAKDKKKYDKWLENYGNKPSEPVKSNDFSTATTTEQSTTNFSIDDFC
jgi:DNA polymerase I-like protein with 3'-5' exonuclease and polymerase domains